MLNKWILFLVATAFALSACNSPLYNQSEANIADVKLKAAAARRKSDRDAYPPPPLLVKKGAYVDTTPIDLESSPSWLKNHIIIRGDQLPFSYYSRTVAAGANSRVLTKFQSGLDPASVLSMSYSGTVRGALDLIAAKTGYVYSVHGNTIYWKAFITKTFDIAFMPGGTDYLMGKTPNSSSTVATSGGGGTGSVSNFVSSDSSDGEYSNLKGTLSIWRDVNDTLKTLISPDGKVLVSESTTSVTVRDRPTNVHLIAQYIENLNKSLSKQVLIKVQILDVKLENAFEYGIDWQIVARAFNKSAFVLNGSYGTPISINTLKPLTGQTGIPITGGNAPAPALPQMGTTVLPGTFNPLPSYTILLNALSQQGKTSVVTEPRVVCLNNQVSVIRIVTQNGYLASIQNTSLSSASTTNIGVGTVTSQLTPGMLITGLTLYILPKIMHEKIYLQVNVDLSTNLGFDQFGSVNAGNTTQIQLPNIAQKSFNQRSVIRSGDTMILSGFRQLSNIANASQAYKLQALGGKGAQETNDETVVLITPIILGGSV